METGRDPPRFHDQTPWGPGLGDLLAPGAGDGHRLVDRAELAVVVHRELGLAARLTTHTILGERLRGTVASADRMTDHSCVCHIPANRRLKIRYSVSLVTH